MTDIVERAKEHLCPEGAVCSDCEMLREAVAEIERLRKALESIKDWPNNAPKWATLEWEPALEWIQEVAREALRHD